MSPLFRTLSMLYQIFCDTIKFLCYPSCSSTRGGCCLNSSITFSIFKTPKLWFLFNILGLRTNNKNDRFVDRCNDVTPTINLIRITSKLLCGCSDHVYCMGTRIQKLLLLKYPNSCPYLFNPSLNYGIEVEVPLNLLSIVYVIDGIYTAWTLCTVRILLLHHQPPPIWTLALVFAKSLTDRYNRLQMRTSMYCPENRFQEK